MKSNPLFCLCLTLFACLSCWAEDPPTPPTSLAKKIAADVERFKENDERLLRDLHRFRQNSIRSKERGWKCPFIDAKKVKSLADYEKLSTPALAKECFKTSLWARLSFLYNKQSYGIVQAGVFHNGFAVLYERADFWDGIAAAYEDLARRLPGADDEHERMDILFNLQTLGHAFTHPPFREKLKGEEEILLRANVAALKAVLGYTEQAKPGESFWGAEVAYKLSCNVFFLLKETDPEKYSQLIEKLYGINLSFAKPKRSEVAAFIQLLVSVADRSTATKESKSENKGTEGAEHEDPNRPADAVD